MPGALAYEPGAQVPGVAAPAAHALPAGHSTQSSALVMATASDVSVAFW